MIITRLQSLLRGQQGSSFDFCQSQAEHSAQTPELNAQAPQLVSGLKGVLEVCGGVFYG